MNTAASDLPPEYAALLSDAPAQSVSQPSAQEDLPPEYAQLLTAQPQQPSQPQQSQSPITGVAQAVGRSLGLAGRAGIEGLVGLPVLAGNVGIGLGNMLNRHLPGYRPENQLQPIDLQGLLNKAGFPQPTGLIEKGLDLVGSTLVGGRLPAQAGPDAPANFVKPTPDALRQQTLKLAQDEGYVVPPSASNPTFFNRVLGGVAGKLKTQQQAMVQNQPVTQRLAAQAVGENPAVPITQDALAGARETASASGYAPVRSFGLMKGDETFNNAIDALTQKSKGASSSFPGLTSGTEQLEQKLATLKQPQFDSSHAVDAISYLRDQANDAFGRGDASIGKAYKGAAKALEDLIERNLSAAGEDGSDLLKNFRDARTAMAKTYSVGKALTPGGEVDARQLASQIGKGKPLTGPLRVAGNFAAAFPKVAGVPKGEAFENVSPLDLYGSLLTAAETHNPALAALPLSRAGLRNFLLSPWAQRNMAVAPAYVPRTNVGLLGGLTSTAGAQGLFGP